MNELKPEQRILYLIKDEPNNTKNLINGIEVIIKKINELSNLKINELEKTYQEINTLKKELEQKYKEPSNKIKCLYHFNNFKHFSNEIFNLYDVNRWKILDTKYEDRAAAIKDYNYYIKVKNDFNNAKLTNWPINDEQLITYFDTLKLMNAVLKNIEDETIKDNLQIIMEYTIQENEKERIDYMLVNNQKIALIECGKKNSINDKAIEKKKEEQVKQYKERLEKSIGHNDKIKIATYTLTYIADNKSTIEGNTLTTCRHLANNLQSFFKDDKNAIQILNEIKEV